MTEGYVAEWFLVGSGEAEREVRAGIARSRLGWPQLLHHHAYGAPCNDQCEAILDPARAAVSL